MKQSLTTNINILLREFIFNLGLKRQFIKISGGAKTKYKLKSQNGIIKKINKNKNVLLSENKFNNSLNKKKEIIPKKYIPKYFKLCIVF
tara:strand:- start:131 stop:397 length:267 start_codon:yes stop_codon:yes gene_type:complete